MPSSIHVSGRLGAVLALLLVTPILTPAAWAQSEGRLFLSVRDETGAPLTDLTADQVWVLEDGVKRETKELRLVGSPPRLSVLVDNGNSTRQILADVQRGLRGFLDALPAAVEVELVAFGGRARMVERWTTDRAELIDAVGQIAPESGAAKYVDALDEARRRYDDLKDDEDYLWPHILVIAGDGREASNTNEQRINRLVQGLYDLPATIHVLFLRTANLQNQDIVQSELSLILTENTRGQFERASVGGTIPDVLAKMAEQIARVAVAQSQQYVLVFERPDGVEVSQTSLQIDRPDARQVQATGDGRLP